MIQPEPPPPPRSESPGLEAKIGRFFEEIWGFLSARRGASRDLRARRRRIGILLQESDEWESVEKVAEGGRTSVEWRYYPCMDGGLLAWVGGVLVAVREESQEDPDQCMNSTTQCYGGYDQIFTVAKRCIL